MPTPDWTLRPAPADYAPYHGRYIAKVPDGDVLATLEREGETLIRLLGSVPPERERFAYAPDKWTLREVVGHVIDAERVMSLRALWFARAGAAPLPSFEENDWARVSNAGERPLAELIEELTELRRASLALFRSFDGAALERRGTASGAQFTTRAMAWIVTGHSLHHRLILQEQYRV